MFNTVLLRDRSVKAQAIFVVLFFTLMMFNVFFSNILMFILMAGMLGWSIVTFNRACTVVESKNIVSL